jgi:hypothetical protein
MAAGLGFKTFTTGEVLTAADTNGYLMQGVLVFASAAARDAAITSPQEGQCCYLKDTDAVQTYSGVAWVGFDDSNAIQNSIVDAKGDIVAASGNDTPARLAVGNNGDTLVVDSSQTTGLRYNPAANKNYLINGGFAVAQRGTSFTSTGGANNDDAYTLDRWYILSDSNDVIDVTQDTTTVPTNGEFAIALDVETVNKKFGIATIIENKDVIGLVGNTVTFSFKAKVSATTKLDNVKAAIVAWSGTADTVTSDIISAWGAEGTNPTLIANATYENTPANLSLTTSYATYSITAAVDTASTQNLILFIWSDVTDTTLGDFLYIAESKLELGSVATPFVYAGGTFQGELAACQRYYFRQTPGTAFGFHGWGYAVGTTSLRTQIFFPCVMRTVPASIEFSNLTVEALSAVTTLTTDQVNNNSVSLNAGVSSGLTNSEAIYRLLNNNNTAGYLAFSAEL